MAVIVVIPVHDHVDETVRCLECLSKQTLPDVRVIVVDGGSSDGTAEVVRARFADVAVIRGSDDWWWTRSTAEGVDYARRTARPGDFILFLNNDTTVEPDYLETLVRASESQGRAVTGSLNVNLHNPEVVIDSGVYWDWASAASRQAPVRADVETTSEVTTLSGRGMLVPIEVFDRIGNVDARRLPHYAADYEFAFRAARAGFPLAVSHRAVVKVDIEISGREGDLATPVSFREARFLLFSRRSIRNVFDRWQLVRLACPRRYKGRNYLAVIFAALWLLTNTPILFEVKHAIFRAVLPARLRRWAVERKLLAVR